MDPLDLAKGLRAQQDANIGGALNRSAGTTALTVQAYTGSFGPSAPVARPFNQQYIDELANTQRFEVMKTANEKFKGWLEDDTKTFADLPAALVVDNLPHWVDYSNALEDALQSSAGNLMTVQGKNILQMGQSVVSAVGAVGKVAYNDPTGLAYKLDVYTQIARGEQIDPATLSRNHIGQSIADDVRAFMTMTPDEQQAHMNAVTSEVLRRQDVMDDVRRTFQRYSKYQFANNYGRAVDLRDIDDLYGFVEYAANAGSNVVASAGIVALSLYLGSQVAPVVGTAAAFSTAALMESAEIVGGLAEEGRLNQYTAARAVAAGMLSGGVEMVVGAPATFMRGTSARLFTEAMGKRALRRLGRVAGRNFMEEGAQEALQSYIQQVGAKGIEGLVPDYEGMWELINSAAMGALGGGMFGSAGSLRYSLQARRAAKGAMKADAFESTMNAVADTIKSIPEAGRTPEVISEITGALGGADHQIFYQATDLADFADKNGIPLPQLLKNLSIGQRDFEAVLSDGGPVATTLDRVVAHGFTLSSGSEFFIQNATTGDMPFSPAQAKELKALLTEKRAEIQKQAEADALTPTRSAVYSYVKDQVIATGKNEREAHALGVTWTSFFDTLSTYTSTPVDQLLSSYGIKIVRGAEATAPSGLQQSQSPTDAFMKDFGEATDAHPFDSRTRLMGLVGLDVSPFGDEIHLGDIRNFGPAREGAGTAALNQLKALADKHGVAISGTAKVYDQREGYIQDTEQLVEWYRREGFEVAEGSPEDGYKITYTPAAAAAAAAAPAPSSVAQTLFQQGPTSTDPRSLEVNFSELENLTFATGRELKDWLQAKALERQEELGIDLTTNILASTPQEQVDAIVAELGPLLEADARYALQDNAGAIGWYDRTTTEALWIAGLVYPEINTDPNARTRFMWALAVTSNGIKVDKNFDYAAQAYEGYTEDGGFPEIEAGQATEAINHHLRLYSKLRAIWGEDNLRHFMMSEFTVSDIKQITGIDVAGENASTVVRGAAILGAKLGNGFYSNLNGVFDALTIDRWNMRTVGRLRGTLIQDRPDMVSAKSAELQALVDGLTGDQLTHLRGLFNGKSAIPADRIGRGMTPDEVQSFANEIKKRSASSEWRDNIARTKGKNWVGDEIRKAGNNLWGWMDGQVEIASNGTEREMIRAAHTLALNNLRADPALGLEALTMSDLQALLWYPEKRLYDAAKQEEGAERGYEEDEAPDYANAARKWAEKRGVTIPDDGPGAGRAADPERADAVGTDAVAGGERGFDPKSYADFRRRAGIRAVVAGGDPAAPRATSGLVARKSLSDGTRLRLLGKGTDPVLVTQKLTAPANRTFGKRLKSMGVDTTPIYEMAPSEAQVFHDAISAAKAATPFGAAVYVYDVSEYADMRLFMAEGGGRGFALKPDGDIVSVFGGGNIGDWLIQAAIDQGGSKLDAYDTVLPAMYSRHGFKVVERLPWNEERKPADWDKAVFAQFNNGEPDVVSMEFDENYYGHGDELIPTVGAAQPRTLQQQEGDVNAPTQQGADTGVRRERGYSSGGLAPLEGAPNVAGAAGPDASLVAVAEQYAAANGIDLRRQAEFVEVDIERATRIAQAYEEMAHAPQDPEVQAAYTDLIQQTIAQYQALVDAGYSFTFFDSATDPYDGNPWNAMRDLRANKTMAVYGTYDGYGTEGLTQGAVDDNPMLQDTGLVWKDQNGVDRPVTANDLFRAVHDAFGHGLEGAGFRARGEENAWQAHVRLFTGPAVAAITSETRGQNSWLNYGPYGEQNQTAAVEDTVFAEQKTGLLPEWAWTEGRAADAAAQPRILEQQQQSGVQGQIEFPAGGLVPGSETVIRLFNADNPTTLLHESGHFFFEMYRVLAAAPNATPQIKAMWEKVNSGLGREAGDVSPLSTAHHEYLARSFEVWFMKGEAPSVGLRAVFRQFKNWLTRTYQAVQSMRGMKLNDDIVDFMERMLATEEEIALARDDHDLGPMFSERPVGMSDEGWQTYRDIAAKEEEEAEERLLRRVMKGLRKRHQQAVEDLLEGRRAELMQSKAFRTVDKVTAESRKDLRLNRAQLVELVGEDVVKRIDAIPVEGKYEFAVNGGGDIYDVADLLGYRDPGVMINDIVEFMDAWDAAPAQADEDHKQMFGDALTDGSLRAQAEAALHTDASMRRLALDMKTVKQMLDDEGADVPDAPTAEAMRALGKRRFADKKVISANKPSVFLTQERKYNRIAREKLARLAGRAAGKRLAPTPLADLRAAYSAMQKAALNHVYYIEAKRLEESLQSLANREKRVRKAYSQKKLLEPYGDHLTALYEMFGLTKLPKDQLPRTVDLKGLVDSEAARTDGLDRTSELNPAESIIAKTREATLVKSAIHYNSFTVSEFEDLKDTLVNLEKVAREEMKILREGHEVSYRSIRADLEATLSTFDEKEFGISDTDSERKARVRGALVNSLKTVDTLLSELDRHTIGSFQKNLAIPVKQALARYTVRDQQSKNEIGEIFKRWLEGINVDEKVKVDELGGVVLKRRELIAMAQNAGNRLNWQRLIGDRRLGNFGENTEARGRAVEAALRNHLSENEWHYVQDMWSYINGFWPEIAALERRLSGVTPQKIDEEIMVSGLPSFVKGGYYPIYYDPRLSASVTEQDLNETLSNMRSGRATRAQTKNGHTKARMEVVDKVLSYDITAPIRHVSSVLFDLEMREPVAVTYRLLNDTGMKELFQRKGLEANRRALVLWIQDVANADRSHVDGFNALLRHFRGGLSVAKMGLSYATLIQQPLGLTASTAVIGRGYTLNAIGKYIFNGMGRSSDAVQAMSNTMKERTTTFERDYQWMMNSLDTDPVMSKWNRVRKFMTMAAFYGMQKAQYWTVDVPTWMAGYDRALAEGHVGQAAVAVADLYLERAQGSGMLASRSAIERGTISETSRNSEFARLSTAFGSYMMSGKFNAALQKVGYMRQNPSVGNIASTLVDLITMFSVETALSLLVTGRWPDEEDMEDWEGWGGYYGFMIWQTGATVMAGVPLLRDVVSAAEGFGGGGAQASAIESSVQLLKGAQTTAALLAGIEEDESKYRRAVRDILQGSGVIAKLPTIQLERILTAIYEEDLSLRSDISLYDLLTGRKD